MKTLGILKLTYLISGVLALAACQQPGQISTEGKAGVFNAVDDSLPSEETPVADDDSLPNVEAPVVKDDDVVGDSPENFLEQHCDVNQMQDPGSVPIVNSSRVMVMQNKQHETYQASDASEFIGQILKIKNLSINQVNNLTLQSVVADRIQIKVDNINALQSVSAKDFFIHANKVSGALQGVNAPYSRDQGARIHLVADHVTAVQSASALCLLTHKAMAIQDVQYGIIIGRGNDAKVETIQKSKKMEILNLDVNTIQSVDVIIVENSNIETIQIANTVILKNSHVKVMQGVKNLILENSTVDTRQ